MIALTLLDRRTREAFTVVVPDGWKPDATVYDITRRGRPAAGYRRSETLTAERYGGHPAHPTK